MWAGLAAIAASYLLSELTSDNDTTTTGTGTTDSTRTVDYDDYTDWLTSSSVSKGYKAAMESATAEYKDWIAQNKTTLKLGGQSVAPYWSKGVTTIGAEVADLETDYYKDMLTALVKGLSSASSTTTGATTSDETTEGTFNWTPVLNTAGTVLSNYYKNK